MIAVDSNILVYAHRLEAPQNPSARARVRELAEGPAEWAIPWPCIHEFLSVVTHPRIYWPPTALSAALEQVEAWLESPSLVLLTEPFSYWTVLRAIVTASETVRPRIRDARIAAICMSHGVTELWTADRDFGRFPGLRVVNPLVA